MQSDLKNVYEIQIHECTPNYSSLAWYTKKVGKTVQNVRCAVVKCALCSGVRSDLSARFKRPRKKKLMLRVSLNMVENWRNSSQITPSAFLSIAPFKEFKKKLRFESQKRKYFFVIFFRMQKLISISNFWSNYSWLSFEWLHLW